MNILKKNSKVIGILGITILCSLAVWKFAIGQPQPNSKSQFAFDSQKPVADYGKVVATVNGYKITEGEVAAHIASLPQEYRAQMSSPAGRKKVIDQMVDEVLMTQAAEKSGLEKDPQVAGEIAVAKRQVIVSALSQKEIRDVKVTDEDVKKWYSEHLADLMQPESVHVKHILVKTEKDAQKVEADLKKKDANFAKIASDVSLDPGSRRLGGDLGFVTRGQTVPEFEQVAFNTPVGKISAPVKTQFGWHIIKVEDKKPAGPIPLDQVKEQIKDRLKFEFFIKPLKDKAKIEITDSSPETSGVPPAVK
jgi:peptidyl-prolyl cis-trans isomerase C